MIRVFVVGSPRSGTTLLQRLLAERLGLATLPETHLVGRVANPSATLRRVGVARRGALEAASEAIGRPVVGARRGAGWSTVAVLRAAVVALDDMAAERGAPGWVEKTPRHLRNVAVITRAGAPTFVHIVRDGAAVAASIVEITHRHPDRWGGPRTALEAARRWAADIDEHQRWAEVDGHAFVRYEDLVADPDRVVAGLASWIDLPAGGAVRPVAVDEIALPDEPWKHAASGPVTTSTDRPAAVADLRSDPTVAAVLEAGAAVAARLPFARILLLPTPIGDEP